MLAATHGEAKPRSAVLCPPLVASGPATAGSGDAGGGPPLPVQPQHGYPVWVKGAGGAPYTPSSCDPPPPRPPPNGCAPVMNPIPLPSCHPLALANEQIDGTCGSHRPFPSFASLAGIYIWLEKADLGFCFALQGAGQRCCGGSAAAAAASASQRHPLMELLGVSFGMKMC